MEKENIPSLLDISIGEIKKIRSHKSHKNSVKGIGKPIQALKDLVLYDDDFEVRRVAAMSLGEVGAYTSF